jgi:hypothetical protein
VLDDGLRSRLMPGERILWSGQPRQGLLFTSRDIFIVPFSLLWFGFVVFWEVTVVSQRNSPGAHSLVPLLVIGGVFILLGLFAVIGRFFLDAWLRRRTSYGVTDRRVLVIRGGRFNKLVALNVDKLPEVSLSEKRDGRGTITFGPDTTLWVRRGFSGLLPSLDPSPRFLEIENARGVFDQIQGLAGPKK